MAWHRLQSINPAACPDFVSPVYFVFPVPGIGGVFQTARRHAAGSCGVLLRGGHSLGMRGDRCESRRSVLASCLGPGLLLCDDTYQGAKWCSVFEQAKLIEVLL